MNPKDMTNSELIVEMVNRTKDYGFLNDPKPVVTELLRRLDEADALRNENEELRNDKERLEHLNAMNNEQPCLVYWAAEDGLAGREGSGWFVTETPWVRKRKLTGIAHDSRESAIAAIDAAKAAESEASHE